MECASYIVKWMYIKIKCYTNILYTRYSVLLTTQSLKNMNFRCQTHYFRNGNSVDWKVNTFRLQKNWIYDTLFHLWRVIKCRFENVRVKSVYNNSKKLEDWINGWIYKVLFSGHAQSVSTRQFTNVTFYFINLFLFISFFILHPSLLLLLLLF